MSSAPRVKTGEHEPLLGAYARIAVPHLEPRRGFESFATPIHAIIIEEGPGE